MSSNRSTPPRASQEPLFTIKNASYQELVDYFQCCPSAGTLEAWSETLDRWVLLQTRCKRWSCPHCAPRRIAHLTHRVVAAKPNKLCTLTVSNSLFENPREAYDRTRGKVAQLSVKIRRAVGEWEYLKVLEVTKKGYPHYHLVVRGCYVDQRWLANEWDKLTGAHVVDIRKIKGRKETAAYVMKYLYKQRSVPWTDRRVSWTRGMFVNENGEKPPSLHLLEVRISAQHPLNYVRNHLAEVTLQQYGTDLWIVNP